MESSPKRHKGTHEDCGVASVNPSALVATEEALHYEVGFDKVKKVLHYCKSCDKDFKTKTELGSHVMNRHTDRNSTVYIEWKAGIDARLLLTFAKNGPSICTTCNKEFKTKAELRSHVMNRHTDKTSAVYMEWKAGVDAKKAVVAAKDPPKFARHATKNSKQRPFLKRMSRLCIPIKLHRFT